MDRNRLVNWRLHRLLATVLVSVRRYSDYGLSRRAHDISVPPRRINEIVHWKRAVTADTALGLARYFGTSERFWLNLHARL